MNRALCAAAIGCNFFLFYMQLFTANFIKYGAKCKCDLKIYAMKLFHYSFVVFDMHNKELSDRLPVSHCYL